MVHGPLLSLGQATSHKQHLVAKPGAWTSISPWGHRSARPVWAPQAAVILLAWPLLPQLHMEPPLRQARMGPMCNWVQQSLCLWAAKGTVCM